jgi:hypothetical protein
MGTSIGTTSVQSGNKMSRRNLLGLAAPATTALLGGLGLSSPASAQITPEQQAALDRHNGVRAIHCSLWNMAWFPPAADAAANWARNSPSRPAPGSTGVIFDHEQQDMYGENIAWGTNLTAAAAVDLWYREFSLYNFSNPPTTREQALQAGHFSQLVWRNTVLFGMGSAQRGNHTVWVARYFPRGNIIGQFPNNVFLPFRAQICPARPPVGVAPGDASAAPVLPTPVPTSPTDILRAEK